MTTIVAERSETGLSTGYNGFLELCRLVEFPIEPFQKRIARLVLEADREALILLPRGNSKTSLQALVALHHLLTIEDAEVFCCASSRDQARILFQYAARFAREIDHPNIVHRHLELRWCPDPEEPTDFTRYLRVLPGVNAKALSGYLGHANIAITFDRYGHLMPGSEAEARDRLNAYLDQ